MGEQLSWTAVCDAFEPRVPRYCSPMPNCVQALREVDAALQLDYLAPPLERQQFALERPLDRHLLPMKKAITLKAALDAGPGKHAPGAAAAAAAA